PPPPLYKREGTPAAQATPGAWRGRVGALHSYSAPCARVGTGVSACGPRHKALASGILSLFEQ
ncbi:hypothetical protein, partial [Escherichia coli]|uniref:hypothetical protein n=1 Tax=Escherichia coli TaxID=562 RepID=UPI001BAEDCA4